MYKKLLDVNYDVINEYEDIINYLGTQKYKQDGILVKFIDDLEFRRFTYDKVLYYYKYFKQIFNDIFTMCDIHDYNYYVLKDSTDMLLNVLDGHIKISDDEIWDILNKNVYNIESKIVSLISVLILNDNEYSLDVRKLSANKGSMYKVRYSCSIKYKNKIVFRIYYGCSDNLTTIKLFSKDSKFNNLSKDHITISSEKELDEILMKYISILMGDNYENN